MKCVLRLIRSDLAAPGVVPSDGRVGYQAYPQIIDISGTILETSLCNLPYPDCRTRKTCINGTSGPDFDGGRFRPLHPFWLPLCPGIHAPTHGLAAACGGCAGSHVRLRWRCLEAPHSASW